MGKSIKIKNIKEKFEKLITTGFFYVFGSSILNKVITFISTTLLVRIVSKTEYGSFSFAWNIFSFILLFSGFGIESGSMQVLSENEEDQYKFNGFYQYGLRTGMKFNVLLAFITIVIALFINLPINGSNEILLILSFLPEGMFIYGMQISFLRSLKENKKFSALSIINTVTLMLFSLLGARIFKARGMAFAYYFANIITIVFGTRYLRVPFISTGYKNINNYDKRDLLSISGISMINNGLAQILYLSDVFIVGIVMTNNSSVATYKVATTIPTALTFIPTSIVIFIYPYFASHRKDTEWCLSKFKQTIFAVGAFNIIITLILLLLAPQIIIFVFGKQYSDAIYPFRILVISYLFQGTFRVISGNLLITQRKLLFNTIEGIISGLINIIADYFFISYYGLIGAAYATLIVMILSGIFCTTYLLYTLKKAK